MIDSLAAVKDEILDFEKRVPQAESSEVITKKLCELQSAIAAAGYSALEDVNRKFGPWIHVMESDKQRKNIDATIDGAKNEICEIINGDLAALATES